MIQAKETYKEELSKHVEGIFKKYVKPGLHICDIATGGGKSYTIGKLTCEYYPKHFDRIVILCVQNKLVEGMNREIDTVPSRIKPAPSEIISSPAFNPSSTTYSRPSLIPATDINVETALPSTTL